MRKYILPMTLLPTFALGLGVGMQMSTAGRTIGVHPVPLATSLPTSITVVEPIVTMPLPEFSAPKIQNYPIVESVGDFEGLVLAKSKDTITLLALYIDADETRGKEKYRPVGEPSRVFQLSAALAAGKEPVHHPPVLPGGIDCSERYTRDHVQLGDIVKLICERVDGKEECGFISILRRPGGRVPIAPGENIKSAPHHDRMNAYQDFEDKDIPLPKRYGGGSGVEDFLYNRIRHVKPILDAAKKHEKK